MMRRLVAIAAGLIILGPGSQVRAEEKVTMGEVVITASRLQEETVKIPSDVTVVTAEDIENSTAQNVAEILQSQAGLHVSDIGGNQRNYSVDLRGFGESSKQNMLLLVDGRRVNLDDLSGADWSLIPPERIARIEIVPGSRGSVLYGDNATAGVINIITKEGGGAPEGTLRAAYGSYDTVKGYADASTAGDKLAFDISAEYLYSEGYRDNSDTLAKDIGGNLRIDPNDRLRIQLSTGYHTDDTRNPGSLFQQDLESGVARTSTTTPDDFDRVDDYYVKAGLELDFLSDQLFKLETSYRNRDKKSYGTFSGGFFESNTETDIYSVSPQLILTHGSGAFSNRAVVGADYSKSEQDFDNHSDFFGSITEIDATLEKEDSAYFVHDELGIGEQFAISGGYRSDRAVYTYTPGTPAERTLDEESYTAGVNYILGRNSHVYGSYTRSFRYPVLDEQFSYFTSTVDTTLKPQTSDDFEVGASIEIAKGLVAGANLFRIDTEEEIFYNPVSYANENMGGTSIRQGAKLSIAWQREKLSLSGSYTRTETEFDGGPYDGKEVPFVPADRATARASYSLGWGVTLDLDATYVGKSYLISDFENIYGKADAYTVVNAKVQYAWRRYTFFADLNNLFNEKYSSYGAVGYNSAEGRYEPAYYPSPEFNFLVGVSVRLGGKPKNV